MRTVERGGKGAAKSPGQAAKKVAQKAARRDARKAAAATANVRSQSSFPGTLTAIRHLTRPAERGHMNCQPSTSASGCPVAQVSLK